MAKKRYSHKQIKQDLKKDELRSLIDKTVGFTKNHTENILITVIIVTVIIVLIPLYFKHQADNEMRAVTMYNQALSFDMQPIRQNQTDQFKTSEEKSKQLEQQYTDIVTNYERTNIARIARMGAANAAFYANDFEKAISLFQTILSTGKDLPMKGSIEERLGNCYEQQKKWDQALNQYTQLLKNYPDYFNRSAVEIRIAKCHQALNQNQEARTILKEQAENSNTYWSTVAKRQLSLMEQ